MRPHYQPESFSSRADNGRGLILRAIAKTPCYNLLITYSISLFQRVWRKNVSKTEEWRKFCVTSRNLFTSDVIKWSTLRAGHDNLSPFKLRDFRLSSRHADNQSAGNSLSHMQTFGYHSKKCLQYVMIRDYLMAFWLSPKVSTWDHIISLRALARGLIIVEGWYWGR